SSERGQPHHRPPRERANGGEGIDRIGERGRGEHRRGGTRPLEEERLEDTDQQAEEDGAHPAFDPAGGRGQHHEAVPALLPLRSERCRVPRRKPPPGAPPAGGRDAGGAGTLECRAMADPPPWELVERELLQDCHVFRVTRSLARSPRTGVGHPFHTLDAGAWVNVVALTPRGELVMVRQWRHGSREVTLEIPGGIVDPGEAPAHAAARELLEETGFGGGAAEPLGSANPNPALFGNRVHTFLIRGVTQQAPVQNG